MLFIAALSFFTILALGIFVVDELVCANEEEHSFVSMVLLQDSGITKLPACRY